MEHELRLTDLVDIDILQRIQDAFSNLTGMAALTTDEDGKAVTEGSNFTEFCMKYTRLSPSGCARCEQCDKHGAELALKNGKSCAYYCHAGLMDFAAPIIANDKLIGCFIGGQVLPVPANEDKIRNVAEEIDVDPDDYIAAVRKVTVTPQETVEKAAEFLYTIANVLSDIAYSRYLVYQANLEIEKAANMKSDFLANMSHEIRTPMNAVIGMAEMALREDLPDTAREYINQIKTSGKSLLTIINDILDFSKIESGKLDILPTEYAPMSIINDITNIIMTRLEDKDVEFILDIDPDIPNILLGDSDRIKQIILNITNNAVKFTREGQVILHMTFQEKTATEILLQVSVEDTGIGIKKEDLNKLFQSFQQVDSKRNRNIEGTGLGLAISKQLLTLMGGSIHVESEYEKGSIFSFEFPQTVIDRTSSISLKNNESIVAAGLVENQYVRQQLKASVNRLGAEYIDLQGTDAISTLSENQISYFFVEDNLFSEELEQFTTDNPHITGVLITDRQRNSLHDYNNIRILTKPVYTFNLALIFNDEKVHNDYYVNPADSFEFIAPEAEILIVDDNAINLTVAEGLLEPLKMNIDTALSGKEAVAKVSVHRYDIVFMDHMMPDMDGVETTHVIRRFHPEYDDMPIIALTANAVDGTKEMFLNEGMNDFVAKPIEIGKLLACIKHWLPTGKIQKMQRHQTELSEKSDVKIPQIGDLDVTSALSLLGSEKLFWSVLKDYYRVIDKKTADIKNYEETENWEAYTIEVHALKSASKQIGAHSLAEKAADLEKAGNNKDARFIHEKTEEMLLQYGGYGPLLSPFFPEEHEDDSTKEFLPVNLLQQYFSRLREAMDNLDIDEMEKITGLMQEYRYEEDQKEMFKQLQEAVENIDVDLCEDIIKDWEKIL